MAIDANPIRALPIAADAVQAESVQIAESCYSPRYNGSRNFDITQIIISGDYMFEVEVQASTSTRINFYGNINNVNGSTFIRNDGSIAFLPETASGFIVDTSPGTYPLNDGLSHVVKVERTGTNASIFFDNDLVGFSGSSPTGNVEFDTIGKSGNFFTLNSKNTFYQMRAFYDTGGGVVLQNQWPMFSKVEGELNLMDTVGSATLTANGFNPGTDPDNTVQIFQCPT